MMDSASGNDDVRQGDIHWLMRPRAVRVYLTLLWICFASQSLTLVLGALKRSNELHSQIQSYLSSPLGDFGMGFVVGLVFGVLVWKTMDIAARRKLRSNLSKHSLPIPLPALAIPILLYTLITGRIAPWHLTGGYIYGGGIYIIHRYLNWVTQLEN